MLRSLDAPERDELAETTTSFSDETSKFAIASPSDRLLHVLAAAAQRRGRGLASWQSFYDQFRYFLVASQRPDGAFEAGLSPEPSALETALAGEAFSTAVGAVILSIQSEATPVLIGRAENPYAPRTDSKGERSAR